MTEKVNLGRKCGNIGCIHNTGILNHGKIHYRKLADMSMHCELKAPRRTEVPPEGEGEHGFWYCEDEERYENLGT